MELKQADRVNNHIPMDVYYQYYFFQQTVTLLYIPNCNDNSVFDFLMLALKLNHHN